MDLGRRALLAHERGEQAARADPREPGEARRVRDLGERLPSTRPVLEQRRSSARGRPKPSRRSTRAGSRALGESAIYREHGADDAEPWTRGDQPAIEEHTAPSRPRKGGRPRRARQDACGQFLGQAGHEPREQLLIASGLRGSRIERCEVALSAAPGRRGDPPGLGPRERDHVERRVRDHSSRYSTKSSRLVVGPLQSSKTRTVG